MVVVGVIEPESSFLLSYRSTVVQQVCLANTVYGSKVCARKPWYVISERVGSIEPDTELTAKRVPEIVDIEIYP